MRIMMRKNVYSKTLNINKIKYSNKKIKYTKILKC